MIKQCAPDLTATAMFSH